MQIGIVGAGPAGLLFALSIKSRNPAYEVHVAEQNPRNATYGFGVVFSARALEFLREDNEDVYHALQAHMKVWPVLKIVHRHEAVIIDGNGFAGISRLKLLQLLQQRCEAAGVALQFDSTVESRDELAAYDLIVGCDGANSFVRDSHAARFQPTIEHLGNKFIWYGTRQVFDCLTLTFRANADGVFVGHHYRYSPDMSTFIVECDAATWARAGFANMSDDEARAYCERVFAVALGSHGLISNQSAWRNFPLITNKRWHAENTVLLGDAARTVHFSIGSGTRLAFEDAIALARALDEAGDDVHAAQRIFETTRRPIADKIVNAARHSADWYEGFAQKMQLSPYELAYGYMTRSGRIDEQRLRETAPRFFASYDKIRLRRRLDQ